MDLKKDDKIERENIITKEELIINKKIRKEKIQQHTKRKRIFQIQNQKKVHHWKIEK